MLEAGTGFSTPRSDTRVSVTVTPQLGKVLHDGRGGERLARRARSHKPGGHVHACPT